jgi:hypothetical protein
MRRRRWGPGDRLVLGERSCLPSVSDRRTDAGLAPPRSRIRAPLAMFEGMSKELWASVDRYLESALLPPDPALDAALEANAAAGLPAIDVAPNQGKLLNLLAQMLGARTILEIGTLGGYSTIWLARALRAGGKLTRAVPSSSTTSCVKGGSSMRRAPTRAFKARAGCSSRSRGSRAWRRQRSRPWAPRATTASFLPA